MRLSKLSKTSRSQVNLYCFMIALALALTNQLAAEQTVVPPDADPTCTVTKKEFKAWFAPNGSVVRPDSVNFSQNPNGECPFFRWAEHMFLWMTSRPSRGNPRSYVFDSSPFYSVSPLDQ